LKNKISVILPIVPVVVLCFTMIALTGGFKEVKLSSSSGSGGIQDEFSGSIYLTIDTSGADTSGAFYRSGAMNTGNNNGTVQGYVKLDYIQDSSDYVDSFVLSLKTAMVDNNLALAWTLVADTFDTSFIQYYSYTGDDTLFKALTWWELNVWDSTSDSIGAADDGTRKYRVQSGFNLKDN